jgi:hypothetical protein
MNMSRVRAKERGVAVGVGVGMELEPGRPLGLWQHFSTCLSPHGDEALVGNLAQVPDHANGHGQQNVEYLELIPLNLCGGGGAGVGAGGTP